MTFAFIITLAKFDLKDQAMNSEARRAKVMLW
jgi:hypothetical protein